MVDVNLIPTEYKKKKQIEFSAIFSKTGGVVIFLFILSLLLYGGLLLYKNALNKNLNDIGEETNKIEKLIDWEKADVIINIDKKLGVVEDLFDGHFYWSELLAKIEELTLPEVYFSDTNLIFSNDKMDVNFSGNALTYTILARQILSFQEDDFVEEVRVSGITLGSEGGIDFNLSIIFSKDILLKHD